MGKKLLVVSAHFPSYRAKYAGHKIAFKILKGYSEKFSEIDLAVICNENEVDLESLSELKNVSVIALISLTNGRKAINVLRSRKVFPLKVMSRFSKQILNYIENNINNYDAVHFEFTHAAYPLIFLHKDIFQTVEVSISCHDILLQSNLRRNFSLLNALDTLLTYKYEEKVFSKVNRIFVLSEKDKELLVSLYSVPRGRIELVSPYISNFAYEARRLRVKVDQENAILFWGAMNRKENAEAVMEFVKEYKDLLEERGYKLYVVGANPTKEVLKLASKYGNVIVTGFVEDPTGYFVKAKYGIVPLLRGAGIKIKTLEMLESGLKVVSTPVGAEGIEHENLIVKNLDEWRGILSDLL